MFQLIIYHCCLLSNLIILVQDGRKHSINIAKSVTTWGLNLYVSTWWVHEAHLSFTKCKNYYRVFQHQVTKVICWFVELGMTWMHSFLKFLATLYQWEISKNGTNIIWTSLKDIQFSKVRGLLLKNWACHAHFHFELKLSINLFILQLKTFPSRCN